MTFSAYPTLASGGWWSPYKDYVLFAKQLLAEFETVLDELRQAEDKSRSEFEATGLPPDMLDSYVHDKHDELHDLAYRTAISCHIFCCMAIEGFANMYGVRRLGEEFYKRNVERLGIVEKVSVIGACCQQWDLHAHPDVAKNLRSLFDARNRLVHPKTQEFRQERIEANIYRHPSEIPISDNFALFKSCIAFFRSADPDLELGGLLSGI